MSLFSIRILLSVSAACFSTASFAQVSLNADRAGNDIARFADADLGNDQCAARCESTPQCQAWVLVKDGSQGGANVCYLKDRISPAAPNPCCNTGAKVGMPIAPMNAPSLQRPRALQQQPAAAAPSAGLRVQADVLRARGDPSAGVQQVAPLFVRSAPLQARGDPSATSPTPFSPLRITTPILRATGARP
ncbi:MAG: PAN domain-containing protein [Pseudomonadota bacterium]